MIRRPDRHRVVSLATSKCTELTSAERCLTANLFWRRRHIFGIGSRHHFLCLHGGSLTPSRLVRIQPSGHVRPGRCPRLSDSFRPAAAAVCRRQFQTSQGQGLKPVVAHLWRGDGTAGWAPPTGLNPGSMNFEANQANCAIRREDDVVHAATLVVASAHSA